MTIFNARQPDVIATDPRDGMHKDVIEQTWKLSQLGRV
jgi:hypothetical protein